MVIMELMASAVAVCSSEAPSASAAERTPTKFVMLGLPLPAMAMMVTFRPLIRASPAAAV